MQKETNQERLYTDLGPDIELPDNYEYRESVERSGGSIEDLVPQLMDSLPRRFIYDNLKACFIYKLVYEHKRPVDFTDEILLALSVTLNPVETIADIINNTVTALKLLQEDLNEIVADVDMTSQDGIVDENELLEKKHPNLRSIKFEIYMLELFHAALKFVFNRYVVLNSIITKSKDIPREYAQVEMRAQMKVEDPLVITIKWFSDSWGQSKLTEELPEIVNKFRQGKLTYSKLQFFIDWFEVEKDFTHFLMVYKMILKHQSRYLKLDYSVDKQIDTTMLKNYLFNLHLFHTLNIALNPPIERE